MFNFLPSAHYSSYPYKSCRIPDTVEMRLTSVTLYQHRPWAMGHLLLSDCGSHGACGWAKGPRPSVRVSPVFRTLSTGIKPWWTSLNLCLTFAGNDTSDLVLPCSCAAVSLHLPADHVTALGSSCQPFASAFCMQGQLSHVSPNIQFPVRMAKVSVYHPVTLQVAIHQAPSSGPVTPQVALH